MSRVPSVDPKRDALLKHYREKLAYFESLPEGKREAVAADETEHDLRQLIADLKGLRGVYRGP